jgi:hypothetical protein
MFGSAVGSSLVVTQRMLKVHSPPACLDGKGTCVKRPRRALEFVTMLTRPPAA